MSVFQILNVEGIEANSGLFINTSGLVGVGVTSTLLANLHVRGTFTNNVLRIEDSSSNVIAFINAATNPTVAIGSSNISGSVYTNPKFIINTGTGVGLMHYNSGVGTVELVSYMNVSDSLFGNASNHDFALITNNVERIKVTAAGNVGINHLTPPATLTIVGYGNTSATTTLSVSNSTPTAMLVVRDDGVVRINSSDTGQLNVSTSASPAFRNAINADATASTGIGVYSIGSYGIEGVGSGAYSRGIYGHVNNTTGAGVYAQGGSTAITSIGQTDDSSTYSLYSSDSSSNAILVVRNDGVVGVGLSNPSAKLDVKAGISGDILRLNNSIFSFANKMLIGNDGSFYSGSINGFGASGTGTFITDQLDYTFKTSFSTYIAFTNAGLVGNVSSYGIIGGSIGSADSNYKLVLTNSDTSCVGNILKIVGAGSASSNDGTTYFHYGVNLSDTGTFENIGTGSFNKIGISINVTGGDLNTALETLAGDVVLGTLSGTGTRFVQVDSTGKLLAGAAIGAIVDGSGTASYIPRWSDTNTIENGEWSNTDTELQPALPNTIVLTVPSVTPSDDTQFVYSSGNNSSLSIDTYSFGAWVVSGATGWDDFATYMNGSGLDYSVLWDGISSTLTFRLKVGATAGSISLILPGAETYLLNGNAFGSAGTNTQQMLYQALGSTYNRVSNIFANSIQIKDGNEGTGKVWTSDNEGNGTWGNAGTSKYAATFTPGTEGVANTITHGLGTTDFSVTLWDTSSLEIIYAKVGNRTTTDVDITFTANPAANVRIVVIG